VRFVVAAALEASMNSSMLTLSPITIPPEVQGFADAKGVSPYLHAVIEVARHAFPWSHVNVNLARDAEVETHQYIALDIEVGGCSADDLLAGQRIWSAGVARVCPARLAVYIVLGWR